MKVAIVVDGATAFGRGVYRGALQFANNRNNWFVHENLHSGLKAINDCPVCDGAIVASADAAAIRALGQRARVVVACNEFAEPAVAPQVCIDDAQVAETVAEHLLGCGLRQFAYYGNSGAGNARLRAFQERLVASRVNCQLSPARLCAADHPQGHADIAELVDWLRSLPKPVGIFACNDSAAKELALACRWASIAVPDQVAIVGVNNDELICESAWPPLSSVTVDFARIGRVAGQQLEALLRGEHISEQPRVTLLPAGSVVKRQSTDLLAVDDPDIAHAVSFIREHACGALTVKDLLRAVPLIRRTLERRFVEKLGRTPYEEITRVRMEMAQKLLRETDEPLPKVAERCGFAAPQALNYMFRKTTGQTPAAYRRMYRSDRH